MNENGFRRIALSMPGAEERSHMGHPDFRANGRIFATLFGIDDESGMVKLPPEAQARLVREHPAVFSPVKGVWGERGATRVCLRTVDAPTLRLAMKTAWSATEARSARSGPGTPKSGGAHRSRREDAGREGRTGEAAPVRRRGAAGGRGP